MSLMKKILSFAQSCFLIFLNKMKSVTLAAQKCEFQLYQQAVIHEGDLNCTVCSN